MIVVVTGPSAAGKTTWCRRFPESTVPERPPATGGPADFWCATYESRWQEALRVEERTGLAVCDDDPMKLHYAWSLARIGETSPGEWEAEAAAVRNAVAGRTLGFADLVLVSLPAPDELRRRRAADHTRRRRNFELHLRLAEPLQEWYAVLAALSAGRVRWSLPPDGRLPDVGPVSDRYDLARYDALIASLPRLG